jgi:hypothetical protein
VLKYPFGANVFLIQQVLHIHSPLASPNVFLLRCEGNVPTNERNRQVELFLVGSQNIVSFSVAVDIATLPHRSLL